MAEMGFMSMRLPEESGGLGDSDTVWVIDPLNRAGWAEVEYVDANTCKVHFPGAQTGTAYLNF